MSLLKEKKGIGVIVSRMQVPYLTDSHQAMINTVCDRHQRVIIFLGTTNKTIDEKNPYPFTFRKAMIEWFLAGKNNVIIIPLPDNEDNARWVSILDSLISSFLSYDEYPILYGGRDSFIPYYKQDKGIFDCTELAPTDYDSGTDLRNLSSIEMPKYTPDTAQAILWTMRQLNNK